MMQKTTQYCQTLLNSIPKVVKDFTADREWNIRSGRSNACIIHFPGSKGEGFYLKAVRQSKGEGLKRDYEVTSWLQDKLPVPDVLYYTQTEEYEYLLLSEMPGKVSCDGHFRRDIRSVVRVLAEGLKMIHSVDISRCPFDQTLDQKLKQAEYNVSHGLVDETDFEPEWIHRTPQNILSELIATRPKTEDLVFTHGDYCLPNILIYENKLGGFIDLGRAGISDRYQDIAIACRSLSHNWGKEWVDHLLEDYGLSEIDEQKMEYYRLMDELF